jgi:hypothetical protein
MRQGAALALNGIMVLLVEHRQSKLKRVAVYMAGQKGAVQNLAIRML